MRDLTEAGRAVAANPALDPTPVEQIATRAHRRRRRQWQSGVAVVAVVVLLSGAIVVAANRNSSTKVAVQPSTTSTVPGPTASPGHQIVSYHGVHVEVPTSWPVVDGMHTQRCGSPFPKTPTAFVGPDDNGVPSCPYIQPTHPGPDGVWLSPSDRPTDATSVTTSSGQTLLQEAMLPRNQMDWFWYHGIAIQIGIGADPAIAKNIRDSIGFTEGLIDTAASGVCARQDHPEVMPTPERLTKTLVLEGGDQTLDPPRPSDQAVVPAADVWRAYSDKHDYERYRLILTRYSAKTPATLGPGGSLTPMDHDVLAWVVYAVPISPAIPGCGNWGLDVTNAITGTGLQSSGYGPGP